MILLALGFCTFCGLHMDAHQCRISFTDPTILHVPVPPPSHYPLATAFLCLPFPGGCILGISHTRCSLQTGFFPSQACNLDSLMSLCGSITYFFEVSKIPIPLSVSTTIRPFTYWKDTSGLPVLTVVKTAAVYTPVRFYVHVNLLSFGRSPGVIALLRGDSGVSLF